MNLEEIAATLTPEQANEILAKYGNDPAFLAFVGGGGAPGGPAPGTPGMGTGTPGMVPGTPVGPAAGQPPPMFQGPGIAQDKFNNWGAASSVDDFIGMLAGENLEELAANMTPEQANEILAKYGNDPAFLAFVGGGGAPGGPAPGAPGGPAPGTGGIPGGPPFGPPPGLAQEKFDSFAGAASVDDFLGLLSGENLEEIVANISPEQADAILAKYGADPKFLAFIGASPPINVGPDGQPIDPSLDAQGNPIPQGEGGLGEFPPGPGLPEETFGALRDAYSGGIDNLLAQLDTLNLLDLVINISPEQQDEIEASLSPEDLVKLEEYINSKAEEFGQEEVDLGASAEVVGTATVPDPALVG
jgi:hypothetical protein